MDLRIKLRFGYGKAGIIKYYLAWDQVLYGTKNTRGEKELKNSRMKIAGYLSLLLLAGVLLFVNSQRSMQSISAFTIDHTFQGESRIGDGVWRPFDEEEKLPAFEGDLVLRGQFDLDFDIAPASSTIYFYLNHIGITISVNGEPVFWSGPVRDEFTEFVCANYWSAWTYAEPKAEDVIEIRLHNPHRYGNANAYEEFLDSWYFGEYTCLEQDMRQESMPRQILGTFILAASAALLGMALGYRVRRIPSGSLLWSLGAFSLFMSGYLLLDGREIEFRSSQWVFNVHALQYCVRFAFLELAVCMQKTWKGKESRAAGAVAAALGLANGILLLLSLANVKNIYDTGLYWAIVQGLLNGILLFGCMRAWKHQEKKGWSLTLSYALLLFVSILELLNGRFGWWSSGSLIQPLFVLLFVALLLKGLKMVAVNHQDSERAKALEEELKNSRVVLAVSQIRAHFIFNVLNAISGMCKYDPERADTTVVRFARYLRSNIDMLQKDELVPFPKALEHLEDYLALEQVRFGEKIRFVKQIQEEDFQIPQLVLQPLVENAIKHGILPKDSGGTIELKTERREEIIQIMIQDDGVGFEQEEAEKEGSVGLSNVRFRLQYMVKGCLQIESIKGVGTKITISLPCKEVMHERYLCG